ncbi:MAG: DUF222 domain-containing protein [Streptosporangiales bacterium]|nr:DUF222 domain-containing protein [Streptosporangiales bacterium]
MFDDVVELDRIEALPASGSSHAVLDAIDLSTAAAEVSLAVLAAYERCLAAAQARQFAALARLDQLREVSKDDFTREEVAAVLRIAPDTAGSRLGVSRITMDRLPATAKLFAAGELTAMHVRVLADAVEHLDPDTTALVEEYALRRPDLPVGQFRGRINHAVAKFDPAGAEEHKDRAFEDRTVWHRPDPGETGILVMRGPAEQTTTIFNLVDDLARKLIPGDTRTLEQRRFDAFVDLVLDDNVRRNITTLVEVTVPVDTLQGGTTPAELRGYGPVSASTARALASGERVSWRRLAFDRDTGVLAAVGDTTFRAGDLAGLLAAPVEAAPPAEPRYTPSARLARFIKARDVTCRFPGCTRRARRTELDHTVPWAAGGSTATWNLHCLCKRHRVS